MKSTLTDFKSRNDNLRQTTFDSRMDKYLVLAWGSNKFGELSLSEHIVKNSILVEQHNQDQPIVVNPSVVRIRHEPICIASGNEHSLLITTDNKLMICGNSKGNRFCEKDYDVHQIYNIKRFTNIKKQLINDLRIVQIATSDFLSLALTQQGIVLAWGGSVSENLSRRKSRLYTDKNLLSRIQEHMNPLTESLEKSHDPNSDLLMPFYQTQISQIACGEHHALALEANSGIVWAWGGQSTNTGSFNKGQCGVLNYQQPDGFYRPVQI